MRILPAILILVVGISISVYLGVRFDSTLISILGSAASGILFRWFLQWSSKLN